MKLLSMTVFILAISVMTGCVKVQVPKTNSIAGIVVDEQNMNPVPGATIFYSNYPEQKVLSDKDGRFELLAIYEERWSPPFPIDHIPDEQNVTVQGGDGYHVKTLISNSTHPMIVKLKRVEGTSYVPNYGK